MANYGKELRMGGDIRRKGKVESATEFVERMKKVHEEAEAALRKMQEEMKRYADRGSVICRSTCPENYIPMVMSPPKNTSPPSMVATFLTTRLMAVLQLSRYSIFHGRDTPIQLGLP